MAAPYASVLKSLIYIDFVGAADRDADDLIRGLQPDAVIVVSSLDSRVACVQAAADGGCAVFVAPPIAATIEDAETMTASCHAAGVKFMVGHVLRFEPCFARARELLGSGALGEALYVYSRQLLPRDEPRNAMSAQEQFLRLAVDHFDLIRWFHPDRELKRIESTPVLSGLGSDLPMPGLTWSYLEFVDGCLGVVQLGWNLFPSSSRRDEIQSPGAGDLKLHIVGRSPSISPVGTATRCLAGRMI